MTGEVETLLHGPHEYNLAGCLNDVDSCAAVVHWSSYTYLTPVIPDRLTLVQVYLPSLTPAYTTESNLQSGI